MNDVIEKAVVRAVEKVLSGESSPNASTGDFGAIHKIVVCQRGFVYAGEVSESGDYLLIKNAVNVRRWGTSKGLGELAEQGNQPETKADACGTVRVHKLAAVALIDCKGAINATA